MISDWNTVILSKVKNILGKITEQSNKIDAASSIAENIHTKIDTLDENINGIKTTSDSISSSVSSLGTINSNVSSVKNTVSSMSSTLSTVNTNVKNLMNSGNGVVKSVQRGIVSSSRTITISTVNLSKSIIITSGDGPAAFFVSSNSSLYGSYGLGRFESSTQIFINVARGSYGGSSYSAQVAWQVIEFY